MQIDLAEVEVVLVKFYLKFADDPFDVCKDSLQAVCIVDELQDQRRFLILWFTKDTVQEGLELVDVAKLLLNFLLKILQLSGDLSSGNAGYMVLVSIIQQVRPARRFSVAHT